VCQGVARSAAVACCVCRESTTECEEVLQQSELHCCAPRHKQSATACYTLRVALCLSPFMLIHTTQFTPTRTHLITYS